jgi:hypothetical protein
MKALTVILENTPRKEVIQMANVFTPQRMRRFKMALFDIFLINPRLAKNILDIFITDILARRRYSPGSIDSIITAMQTDPTTAENKLASESQKITNAERDLVNQSALAQAKGMGWFKARAFFTLLLGGLAGIPLFIMFWNGIYTPENLAFSLRQSYHFNGYDVYVAEIMKEGKVFYDALTLKMFETYQQLTETQVGKEVVETSKTLAEKTATKYTELTEPARPKPALTRFANYIADQYSYFTSSSSKPPPPPEMR